MSFDPKLKKNLGKLKKLKKLKKLNVQRTMDPPWAETLAARRAWGARGAPGSFFEF